MYLVSEANGPNDLMLDEVDLQLRCLDCKCTLSVHVCLDSRCRYVDGSSRVSQVPECVLRSHFRGSLLKPRGMPKSCGPLKLPPGNVGLPQIIGAQSRPTARNLQRSNCLICLESLINREVTPRQGYESGVPLRVEAPQPSTLAVVHDALASPSLSRGSTMPPEYSSPQRDA